MARLLTLILITLLLPPAVLHAQQTKRTYSKTDTRQHDIDRYRKRLQAIESKRELFLRADRALKKKNYARYRKLLPQLRDYPLYPYLLAADYSARLDKISRSKIDRFLQTHGNTLAGKSIRQKWLALLAKRRQWHLLLKYYKHTSSRSQRCLYRTALYHTGQRQAALRNMNKIWLTHKALPKSCNFIVSRWYRSGGLTATLVWKRAALMFGKRRWRHARTLAAFLPKKERFRLYLWKNIHRKPKLLKKNKVLFSSNHYINKAILVYSLARLARRDPDLAIRLYNKSTAKVKLNSLQKATVFKAIGMTYAYRKDPKAAEWLARVPAQHANARLKRWRVRVALTHENWNKVLYWLDRIDRKDMNEPRWKYWRARALEETGRRKQARRLYREVAKTRSFEGFLAADRLKAKYIFDHRRLYFSPRQMLAFETRPDIAIAREFYFLGRKTQAKREWWYLTNRLNEKELKQAAILAQKWGWLDRAILTLAKTSYRDDLSLRFPVAHKNAVIKFSKKANIDPAWAMAVIRRESAFAPDARSHVGARGLMQLMPRTARSVARTLKTRLRGTSQLYKADFNIHLGTTYLKLELAKFSGHKALATAAYNAGPNRVKQWLRGHKSKAAADIWIESIPFKETRNYTRAVLTYMAIYERRMGLKPRRISDRLRPVSLADSVNNSSVVKF